MAVNTQATKLANVVNPEVLSDMVNKKLVDAIKFSPLATVDYTLEGTPGSTITLPSWKYVGDSVVTEEGESLTIKKLTSSMAKATIHKLGLAVEVTDEAVLSGYGDPLGEAAKQIALSIGGGVDGEVLSVLEAITGDMEVTSVSDIAVGVNDALEKFGEDVDGTKVLVVAPAELKKLRASKDWLPASEIAAGIMIKGTVGEIYGCQVQVSNKLKGKNEAFIVMPEALRIFIKRDVLLETDRDILNRSTVIAADKHFVAYLYDATKAVKLTLA